MKKADHNLFLILDSLFSSPAHPYKDILLAKCDEVASIISQEINGLSLPFTLSSSINEKNIYHAFVTILLEGKKAGAVNLFFSPKKGSFTVTTDKSSDEMINHLYSLVVAPVKPEARDNLMGWHIYTDGSFNGKDAAWAFIILKDGEVFEEAFGVVQDRTHASTYQIVGEFTAVVHALKRCDELEIPTATLHYDLDLIGKIATGRYKAKAAVSQFFLTGVSTAKVKITWNKVKAHNGNKWNERVDKLASRALSNRKDLSLDELFNIEFGS